MSGKGTAAAAVVAGIAGIVAAGELIPISLNVAEPIGRVTLGSKTAQAGEYAIIRWATRMFRNASKWLGKAPRPKNPASKADELAAFKFLNHSNAGDEAARIEEAIGKIIGEDATIEKLSSNYLEVNGLSAGQDLKVIEAVMGAKDLKVMETMPAKGLKGVRDSSIKVKRLPEYP